MSEPTPTPPTITLEAVSLPTSLVWVDEHNWSPVQQNARRALSGNLVVFYASNIKGRPITLQSPEDAGWVTRAIVDDIQALSEVAGAIYTLVIGDQSWQVMFRHDEPPAFMSFPLIPRINHADGDYNRIELKLFTV